MVWQWRALNCFCRRPSLAASIQMAVYSCPNSNSQGSQCPLLASVSGRYLTHIHPINPSLHWSLTTSFCASNNALCTDFSHLQVFQPTCPINLFLQHSQLRTLQIMQPNTNFFTRSSGPHCIKCSWSRKHWLAASPSSPDHPWDELILCPGMG